MMNKSVVESALAHIDIPKLVEKATELLEKGHSKAEVIATTTRKEVGPIRRGHVGDEVRKRTLLMEIQGEVDACAGTNNITISPWAEAHVVMEARLELELLQAMCLAGERDAVVADEAAGADRSTGVEHDAPQCGFCTPGQVMSAVALLANNPRPTKAEAAQAMSGNLCRCGTYPRIKKAIKKAILELKG